MGLGLPAAKRAPKPKSAKLVGTSLGVAASLLLGHARGANETPTVEVLQKWLEAESESSRSDPDLAHVLNARSLRVRLAVESHHPMHPTALDALRREVKGDPRHPEYVRLAQAENYLKRGACVERRTAWMQGGGGHMWRVNSDFDCVTDVGQAMPSHDTGWRPDGAWLLNGPPRPEIVLFDPRKGFPPNRDISGFKDLALNPFRELLFARIGWLGEPQIDAAGSRLEDPDQLELRVVSKSMQRIGTIRARWDASTERALVSDFKLESTDVNAPAFARGFMLRATGWLYEPVLSRWIAGRVEIRSLGGDLERAFVYTDAIPIDEKQLEFIVATPSPDKADGVRDWRIERILDYSADPGAPVRHDPFLGRAPLITASSDTSTSRWLRYLGWATGVVLVGALIVIRLARKRATADVG